MKNERERPLHMEERRAMHELLAKNPNHFGTLKSAEMPIAKGIQLDTTYEQLTCLGVWPEENLIEATIAVKLPFGFLGNLCTKGTTEYVRFFIDWNADGSFTDFNEDLGLAQLKVHDVPDAKEHTLCYAVALRFRPLAATCKEPYIVKVRAILSWEIAPTGPSFIPIWGNVLDRWVQIDPVRGTIVAVLNEAAEAAPAPAAVELERERAEFLQLLEKNPNHFGTLTTEAAAKLPAIKPLQGDTRFEELQCIGLYPEKHLLEAVLEIKQPVGYLGDLCRGGSHEYVRFFADWTGDGTFLHPRDDIGMASVRVHDLPEVRKVHLSYALGHILLPPQETSCQAPRVVRVRAILSWQQVPTGPDFIPVWGNVVECWVQIQPNVETPRNLVGSIDDPVAGACASPVLVPACATSGGAPLIGIRIHGTAAGLPFDRYTLRYSAGGGPIVDDAIVYPDCTRAPATASHRTPVVSGTLGYLDVGMLPPGMTDFTVYLDVFDAGTTDLARTVSFQLRTKAVEISAAATVQALTAPDPFNPLAAPVKLIKASNDPSVAVPEVSIGGAFSVDGSAYLVGCNRILSQFVLASVPISATSPVPDIPNAGVAGATNMISPVSYADTTAHPWQSGCLGSSVSPNIILNGRLTAYWGSLGCTFGTFHYSVPKVQATTWSSGASGRYVLVLETRDRALPGGGFPGTVAAKDQVVVWIDNESPVGEIHSVGGLVGCGDLRLSDFRSAPAEIRGVAWDPPIDAAGAQRAPNDNFGSYSLTFQRNGVPAASGTIPAATPTSRVPAGSWPTLPPGADGLLASWNIVADLDGGTGPLAPSSPKILRGTRCAYVITLEVSDTTHVGDSGGHHGTGAILYAFNVINDLT